MAPRRPETSRQTETVVQTPPIINRNVNPQTSPTRANNQNQTMPNINTTNNNSDIKALLSTTVQCLIQLLNAMNTTQQLQIIFLIQLVPHKRMQIKSLRHEHRNPHDPGNYYNDWFLDQSAASYMPAGYSPQSFLLYFSDMGMEARFASHMPRYCHRSHRRNQSERFYDSTELDRRERKD
ncbi:hypothetical protein TNCV_1922021 [Trichonephila clavipes]|nr:hypothetical protein TNCV_1922021 [Trichonephila clavipes]